MYNNPGEHRGVGVMKKEEVMVVAAVSCRIRVNVDVSGQSGLPVDRV